MANLQQRIIAELGVKPAIEPTAEIRRRVDFLTDYLRSTPAQGFVLGIRVARPAATSPPTYHRSAGCG